jgi:hypothetical protein
MLTPRPCVCGASPLDARTYDAAAVLMHVRALVVRQVAPAARRRRSYRTSDGGGVGDVEVGVPDSADSRFTRIEALCAHALLLGRA